MQARRHFSAELIKSSIMILVPIMYFLKQISWWIIMHVSKQTVMLQGLSLKHNVAIQDVKLMHG